MVFFRGTPSPSVHGKVWHSTQSTTIASTARVSDGVRRMVRICLPYSGASAVHSPTFGIGAALARSGGDSSVASSSAAAPSCPSGMLKARILLVRKFGHAAVLALVVDGEPFQKLAAGIVNRIANGVNDG